MHSEHSFYMTDEETTKSDSSSDESQADGSTKKEEGASSGDGSSSKDEKIDYKVLLEETKEQLKKAEHKIIDLKRNKSASSKDDDGSDDDEDDDDSGTEDVLKLVDEKLNELKKGQVSDIIADTLAEMSDDPSEQELIALIYDKKLVKSGYSKQNILSDLETARLIANKGRIQKSSKELEAKKKSDQAKQSGNSGSGQRSHDDTSEAEIQLSRKDQEIMKRFGLTKEDVIKNSNR